MGLPLNTPVLLYIKGGFKGVYFSRTCFPDGIYLAVTGDMTMSIVISGSGSRLLL